MTPEAHFRATAPRYMRMLMADFGLTAIEAAAVFGNLGHESLGFTKLQEITPAVKGSKGGYGWAQWTGPRRRAFEAYCKRNGLDPASDEANYKFLFVELSGPEKAALTKLRAAKTLDTKTVAFEKAFERAGVKHYASRKKWAQIALQALEGLPAVPEPELPAFPRTDDPAGKAPHPLVAILLAIVSSLASLLKGRKP